MKLVYSILLLSLYLQAFPQQTFRIAFGSCSDETKEEQLWADISKTEPTIWIWGGDNIYGDTTNLEVLKNKYDLQKNRRDYRKLISQCAVTGTWDDHDYGVNDGGKHFSIKPHSKMLAADFLGFSKLNPVWKHEGLYNSTLIKEGQYSIKIINLDTRYFRDTIYKEHYIDTLRHKKVYRYLPNATGDMLGEAQWKWLEDELSNSGAVVNIINSSIQVIAAEHRFEKWANLPASQKRLFKLLAMYPDKKVIIISGDRHIAELSRQTVPGINYPLYDFTCSGLTHTWSETRDEKNPYRVGELIVQRNFGLIELMVHDNNHLSVTFSVMGKGGAVYQTFKTEL
jgi:alkaline phosphatase D